MPYDETINSSDVEMSPQRASRFGNAGQTSIEHMIEHRLLEFVAKAQGVLADVENTIVKGKAKRFVMIESHPERNELAYVERSDQWSRCIHESENGGNDAWKTWATLKAIEQGLSLGQDAGLGHPDLTEANVNAIDSNYGEGSGPNKRPHTDQPLQQQDPGQQQPSFQSQSNDRTKVKGQKRVGKKAEPQPLVGMFNDSLGKYDPLISIRHVLQTNKIDMTWKGCDYRVHRL